MLLNSDSQEQTPTDLMILRHRKIDPFVKRAVPSELFIYKARFLIQK